MTAENLSSNSITGLNGTNGVITYPNPNGYGPSEVRYVSDFITPTTTGLADTGSTYRVLRLKSTVSLRELWLQAGGLLDTGGASAAFAVDVGAYYSNSTTDGTNQSPSTAYISVNCFCAAHSFATTSDGVTSGAASTGDRILNGLYSLNQNLIGSPLWKQAGLSADPGGFIDIVVAVHTAANAAGATPFSVTASYTL